MLPTMPTPTAMQMVALLLSHGADMYARNSYGHSPAHLAAGDSKCSQAFDRVARDGEAGRLRLGEDLAAEQQALASRAEAEAQAERQRCAACGRH